MLADGEWYPVTKGATVIHPDFEAAPPAHRWTKPLHELGVRLREAAWKKKGGWAWYVVPNGACTSMRVQTPEAGGNFTKELRISRRGVKSRDPLPFQAEAEVFRKHLGCDDWTAPTVTMDVDPDVAGTWHAVALMVERRPLGQPKLGTKPENKCAKCGEPAPHEPAYREDLCNRCATEAGARDVESRRQRPPQETLL